MISSYEKGTRRGVAVGLLNEMGIGCVAFVSYLMNLIEEVAPHQGCIFLGVVSGARVVSVVEKQNLSIDAVRSKAVSIKCQGRPNHGKS